MHFEEIGHPSVQSMIEALVIGFVFSNIVALQCVFFFNFFLRLSLQSITVHCDQL